MDHLPKVGIFNRIKRTLEIPYLIPEASRQWIPRGVSAFRQLQDYMLERLPADEEPFVPKAKSFFGLFLAKPQKIEINRQERGDDVLRAAQLALWQGVLVEAFAIGNVLIDINKFITQNEYGELIVTTAALTEYICYWHLNVDHISDETRISHLDQLFDLFRTAAEWFLVWATRLHFLDSPPSAQVGYSMRLGHPCHNRSYPRVQAILLSIQILHETLYNVALSVYSTVSRGPDGGVSIATPDHEISNNLPVPGYYDFVDTLMLDAGWCPNEVALLPHQTIRTRQHTLRYFLSTVDRRSLGRDHSRCTRHRCYKVVEYPYSPDHVTANCTCPNVFTSTENGTGVDVATIIREGLIPLVKIRSGGTDSERLDILSYNPATEPSLRPTYIAISHVWSDGKGNRAGNYLPACQIRRLQDSVNYAHYFSTTNLPDEEAIRRVENVPFWIDTLCIPRHHQAEKKMAIRTMTSVYHNAASVLVLDQGLKRTNLQTSLADIYMAVAHSNWSRRLWTLQEGRLALKLQFEFENGLLSLHSRDDLKHQLLEAFYNYFPQQMQLEPIRAEIESGGHNRAAAVLLLHALASQYGDLAATELYRQHLQVPVPAPIEEYSIFQRFFDKMEIFWRYGDILKFALNAVEKALSPSHEESAPSDVQFFDIAENLRLRRTTEPSDEAVSMATMLDADVNMILNTENEDRMAALLQSLNAVPSSLCFFQGERYTEDGKRWIPKSFLLQNGRLGNIWGPQDPKRLLKSPAKPTPNGLQTSLPGIQFLSPLRSNDPERCYLIIGTETYAMVLTEGNKLKVARTDWSTYVAKKLAIILSTALTCKTIAWGGILVSHRNQSDLVPDEEEGQSTDYVRFEHTVILHKCEQGHSLDQLLFYNILIDWPGFDGKEEFISAAALPEDHKWCIG